MAIAQAVRNSGGLVLAQVERLSAAGTLHPQHVRIPGIMVDAIIVAPSDQHQQCFGEDYNPAYCGDVRILFESILSLPMDERKIIGQMDFVPQIAANLRNMDKRVFRKAPMGLPPTS